MKITWTNCAEQMPPDDRCESIIKLPGGYYKSINRDIWNEKHLYGTGLIFWTPYTPEKWNELNK